MIATIIFDMDGVLINSQSLLDTIEFNFLKEVTSNRWTVNDQFSIHGKSIEDVYNLLISTYGLRASKKTFLERYEDILNTVYRFKCKLNPGVISLLDDVVSRKYTVVLASSTPHRFINIILDKFTLRKYFKAVVSGDDTSGKSKPEPDIFLITAEKLNVKPSECLVIEDSINGIKAAKRAGMFCLEYSNGKYRKTKTCADLRITTFRKISIDSICSRLKDENNRS